MSTNFSSQQNLVRGGLSQQQSLRNNFYDSKRKSSGKGTISARSASGMTVSELAYAYPCYNNGSYSYTTIGQIWRLGEQWGILDTPSKDPNVPFHVDIKTPRYCCILDDETEELSKIFNNTPYDKSKKLPNYGRGKRR